MIPKIVHYCWFGNTPKNYLANRCVKSFNKLGGGKNYPCGDKCTNKP